MDCENCRHLTVVGLRDTGPWWSVVLHNLGFTKLLEYIDVSSFKLGFVYAVVSDMAIMVLSVTDTVSVSVDSGVTVCGCGCRMIHAVDWYPTFISMAGGEPRESGEGRERRVCVGGWGVGGGGGGLGEGGGGRLLGC